MPMRVDNDRMRARFLAIGAAVWTAANAGIYFLVISAQGNTPAWWYLAVLGTSTLLFALAAGRLWPVPLLITGAILLTGAALAGVLSIGMLLVPGVLAAVAALGPTRGTQAGRTGAGMPTG
jgi:hypothetical protein